MDVDDIAEVVIAALTEPGHSGEIYEVDRSASDDLADIAGELSKATDREIAYVQITHAAFVAGVTESDAPKEVAWMLDYLFTTVLDGRNAYLSDGVERTLGRPPKDFLEYARSVAETGLWRAEV